MSAPKHDTWMPLYVADYLKDTRHLSGIEHGAYLLLLMHAWTCGGSIPRNDAQLARIACLTPAEWKRAKKTVLEFWIDFGEAGEILMHKRVMAELDRSKEITEKRSKAGARGAAGRWQADADANGKRMANASDGLWQNDGPSPSPSFSSKKNNARDARLSDEVIDWIWSEAPSKARERSSKADVRRTLAAAVKRGGGVDEISRALKAYWRSEDASKADGAYAKGIHRMIEGDRWRDWASDRPASHKPADEPINWAMRMSFWRKDGTWLGAWGPTPREKGCQCPPELLEAV